MKKGKIRKKGDGCCGRFKIKTIAVTCVFFHQVVLSQQLYRISCSVNSCVSGFPLYIRGFCLYTMVVEKRLVETEERRRDREWGLPVLI